MVLRTPGEHLHHGGPAQGVFGGGGGGRYVEPQTEMSVRGGSRNHAHIVTTTNIHEAELDSMADSVESPRTPSQAEDERRDGTSMTAGKDSTILDGTVRENRQASIAEREDEVDLHPFMLRPHSLTRTVWDLVTLTLLIYMAIVVPFRLGFDAEASGAAVYIETTIDFFFILDLLINFRTGYLRDDDSEVTDPKKVAVQYFKGWFLLDFISAIPYDLIFNGLSNLNAAKLIKLNRLMKVFRVLRLSKVAKLQTLPFFEDLEDWLSDHSTQNAMRMIKLLLLTGFSSHIIACFWSLIGMETSPSWMDMYPGTDADPGMDDLADPETSKDWNLGKRYVAAQYWAITTMTTVGYGDIIPANNAERVYSIVAMVIGGGFYGYIIATMASVVTSMDRLKRDYTDKIESIGSYMETKHFPQNLRRKVRRYFKRYYGERTALDETGLLHLMTPKLREEVTTFLFTNDIAPCVLFDGTPSRTLAKLIALLKPIHTLPGDIVLCAGDTDRELYILTAGKAVEYAGDASQEVLRVLDVGDSIGETMCFGDQLQSSTTLQTVMDTSLYAVSRESLHNSFKRYPEQLEHLRSKALEIARSRECLRPSRKSVRQALELLTANTRRRRRKNDRQQAREEQTDAKSTDMHSTTSSTLPSPPNWASSPTFSDVGDIADARHISVAAGDSRSEASSPSFIAREGEIRKDISALRQQIEDIRVTQERIIDMLQRNE